MKIYTDASTRAAQGISGVAFVVTDSKDREISRHASVVHESDNNSAELRAICYALAYSKSKNPNEHVTILTDSTYAINAIRNGHYRPSEEKLLEYIYENLKNRKCAIFWCKGHCQDGTVISYYNKIADKTAKKVRKKHEEKIKAQKKLKLKIALSKKGKSK